MQQDPGTGSSRSRLATALFLFAGAAVAFAQLLQNIDPAAQGLRLIAGVVVGAGSAAGVVLAWPGARRTDGGRHLGGRLGEHLPSILLAFVVGLVVFAFAVAGSADDDAAADGGPLATDASAPTTGPTTTTVPVTPSTAYFGAQPCRTYETTPTLLASPRSNGPSERLTSVSYTLVPGVAPSTQPRLAITGRILGPIDADQEVHFCRSEDPATQGSAPSERGNANYILSPRFHLNDEGCWSQDSREIDTGNTCVAGLTFRYDVALIDRALSVDLDGQRGDDNGFDPQRIETNPGITLLGRIEVPTEPFAPCLAATP
jgi:hypothetical protein